MQTFNDLKKLFNTAVNPGERSIRITDHLRLHVYSNKLEGNLIYDNQAKIKIKFYGDGVRVYFINQGRITDFNDCNFFDWNTPITELGITTGPDILSDLIKFEA